MKKYILLTILTSTVVLMVGCKKEIPNVAKTPSSITDLSDKIIFVAHDQKSDATEVIVQFKTIWNEEAVVFAFASEANNIAKGIQQHFKDVKTSKIRFTVEAPLADKYGNSVSTRVLAVNYRTSDIYRINYEQGFELQQFLNLYESVWYVNPSSHKFVYAFCTSEVGQYANVFCKRERFGQGDRTQ